MHAQNKLWWLSGLAMSVVVGLTACGGSSGSSNTDAGTGTGTGTGTSLTTPEVDCPAALALVDVSVPSTVVGTGTPASCSISALKTALSSAGVITFDCGSEPLTIEVDEELTVTADTVLDGGGLITLDGGGSHRILAMRSSFELNTPSLTVQRLSFQRGASSDTGEDTTSGGAAIYRVGGRLTVIDSQFINNAAPASGQDIAGGAIYSLGGGETIISGSGFSGNSASNGGAIGNLHNDLTVVNSAFSGNTASGTGGNPGNGGNGGAVYIDGVNQDVSFCGVNISANRGNAFGGGVFQVSNNGVGTHVIERSSIDGNTLDSSVSFSSGGGVYLQGVDITISNSTVSRNTSSFSGGAFIGPSSQLAMINSTVAENESLDSLGGGITISSGVTGLIKHVTFANNRASDSDSFAAAIVGGAGVILQNSLVNGHTAGNGFNPISCNQSLIDGSGNQQFPVLRAGAGSDDPTALCASSALIVDAQLSGLANHGGDTETLLPETASPVVGLASDCPDTDQRGVVRSEPCTAGAVEVTP